MYYGSMNLWNESLWGDEAFSAMAVRLSFGEMIKVVMKDTAPPLFYFLGFLWQRLTGGSEIGLRSLSLILVLTAGIFAGLTVFELGKSKLNGLLAFLLTIFSPFLFTFAFEWRMYALLSATITMSSYAFLTKRWKLYVLGSVLALYTHHFAVFTIFVQFLVFMVTEFRWRQPKTWLKTLWPYLTIGLIYSFWLYPMYLQIIRVKGSGFWLSRPTLSDVANTSWRLMLGGVGEKWRPLSVGIILLLLLFKDWKKVGWKTCQAIIIGMAPIFISAGLSYVITPIFYDRYLLSVIPMMAVVWTLGTRKEIKFGVMFLILIYSLGSYARFTNPTKRPFREMAMEIKKEMKDGDLLLNYNGTAHHIWESKYYKVPAPIYTPGGPLPLYVGTAQMTKEDTTETIPTPKRRLIVISSEQTSKMVLPGYRMVKENYHQDIGYSVWVKK
jgi:uncharacterized membrane protein